MPYQAVMVDDEIHVGDIGSEFGIIFYKEGVPFPIADAIIKTVIFWKPVSQVRIERAGSFKTNGNDGHLVYSSVAGDLTEPGLWKMQGYVKRPIGEWHTAVAEFRVKDNLRGINDMTDAQPVFLVGV